MNHTLLSYHWTSQKPLTQYDTHNYYKTGSTRHSGPYVQLVGRFSTTILTALYSEANCPRCSASPQASSRGQAIGPAAYVVTAGDLVAAVPGNSLCKYADDTYVIIPASNEASRLAELDNVQRWAEQNNLKLNCSKSTEIVFRDSRRRRTAAEPAPLPGIARSSCMKMLGVTIGNDLAVSQVSQHVQ